MTSDQLLRAAFDDCPLVEINGRRFVINPLTEQVPATPAEMLQAAAWGIVSAGDFGSANVVVGEEDKGGVLVAAVSMVTGLPFGLARWYPSGLEGQISVEFGAEYVDGRIYLNGVQPDDEVVIVDDLISTGGTMIALINAIEQSGARIRDIICVAEKVEYEGRQRVKDATGHDIKCLLQLSIAGLRCKVL
ncbi:MAG TPA: phosphoribosyltransferase family protein [Streptosporangiaceae bacterium]